MMNLQGMEQGRTPLIFAASARREGCVEAALTLGADPKVRDELGWTALMASCRLIEGASGEYANKMMIVR